MINYELAKQQGPGLKAALSRAAGNADPAKRFAAVKKACQRAVAAWRVWGAWPDNWHSWNIALSDAYYAYARSAPLHKLTALPETCPRLEDFD